MSGLIRDVRKRHLSAPRSVRAVHETGNHQWRFQPFDNWETPLNRGGLRAAD